LLLIAPALFAEMPSDLNRLLAALKTQKKEIIAKNMVLTDKEQKDFWPLYEEYQRKTGAIDKHLVKLLDRYITADESISEKLANELLDETLKAEKDRLKLKKTYARKFREVLQPKKVVKYFFLESKLEAIKGIEFYTVLPLIY
jgi:anion-transporting  ArsA/GET3 family ATPase